MTDTPPSTVAPLPLDAKSWDRLRAIIESLADGIVIVDHGGVIRFANPAAARLADLGSVLPAGTGK